MADDGGGPQQCGLRTLHGAYVLAASGFTFAVNPPQPKAIVEQIDFDGQGRANSPGAAIALNGSPALNLNGSNGGGGYEVQQGLNCVFKITFANGPAHYIFMAPDGDIGWTLQANPNNSFQGTLTRVWPPKDHDDRH